MRTVFPRSSTARFALLTSAASSLLFGLATCSQHAESEAKDSASEANAKHPNRLSSADEVKLAAALPASERSSARWDQRGALDVALGKTANEPTAVTDRASRVGVRFALAHAKPAALELGASIARYRSATADGADVVMRASASGVEDFVSLDRAPASGAVSYAIDLDHVAGLRLVAKTLELLDATGAPRIRVSPPSLVDASGKRRALDVKIEGCGVDESPRAPYGRAPTAIGATHCALVIAIPRDVAYPAIVDPEWIAASSMNVARSRHAITVLAPNAPASAALVTGGFDGAGDALASAELYEPLSRTFAVLPNMTTARGDHTASLLQDGDVLVAGGATTTGGAPIGSSERYVATNGSFALDAPLATPRSLHTATVLADGRVLVAGGQITLGQSTRAAELYDPTTLQFTTAPSLAGSRAAHTASLLLSGDVLIAGGIVTGGFGLQSAEIWSSAANAFQSITTTGTGVATQMSAARGYHAATVLANGDVLLTGGVNATTGVVTTWSTADTYVDQASKRGFATSVVGMISKRARHTATLLPTGDVVVAGGTDGASDLASTELYSPSTNAFALFAALGTPRRDAASALVNAGGSIDAGRGVLVSGGVFVAATLSSGEVLNKAPGDACTIGNECASGFCVTGVCCDTACDAQCRSCTAAAKGTGADGVCGFTADDTDLGWHCLETGNVETHEKCVGGLASAIEANTCGPNKCDSAFYRCSHDCPCSDGGFCTDAGPDDDAGTGAGGGGGAGGGDAGAADASALRCEDRKGYGEKCGEGPECQSGFCVDGVCCNSACDGQCQACDTTNEVGTCFPVGSPSHHEAPHSSASPMRAVCDGDGACQGYCDGSNPNACAFPKSNVVCNDPTCVCDDGLCDVGPANATTFACSGDGKCSASEASCDGFKCDVTSCKTSCASDGDCLLDFICSASNVCEALVAPLCDGDHVVRIPMADDQDCTPYKCDPSACKTTCKSVDDCVAPAVCSAAGVCEAEPPAPSLASCSTSAPRDDDRSIAFAALGLVALAFTRRRRR